MCYYCAPVAFLFGDSRAFFMILQVLLLLLIVGLTFLAMLLQPMLEDSIAWVMVKLICCRDKRIY